jgi:hypothetical protein
MAMRIHTFSARMTHHGPPRCKSRWRVALHSSVVTSAP